MSTPPKDTMDIAEFREAGHRMVELVANYFETIEDRALFPDIEPRALAEIFAEPMPRDGEPASEVLREVETKLLPHCTHVNHPGYMGLITPTPTPMGVLGDFLASALNQNVGAYSIGPGSVAMERRVVRWLTDLAGYGERAGGNLTSGGMMANFLGLKLARDALSGDRAQHEGVRGSWAVYVSEERHVSLDKAVDAVGIGRDALRPIPTDERFCVRLDLLEAAIEKDRREGVRPMCVIGLAGTTNTGSIDDLRALRRIADAADAWLHVDAAYGGGMLLSEKRPGRLAGLELADSIALDPHKWFYAPLDAGAVLVKDAARLTTSFGIKPSYLTDEFDPAGERYQYYVHGFEQSRRFRSLKVWMSFKRYGSREIGRWVDANIDQAEHFYARCRKSAEFEPAVEPQMSAICARYRAGEMDERARSRLHHAVARRVEQSGRFWIGTTVLKGRTYFRINPVNLRTRIEHMDELFELLRSECAK
jgi:glutamate/tyrosine decarboxylase-like PLP-dependent enzyme